ncbi:MAG: ABC transporter permease [Treponema sp.]|nr:ABC transporter permease [Treponema sp.]
MRFIGSRIIIAIVTLLLVSVVSFASFRLISGDAAILSLGTEASEAQIADLRAQWGLDKSVPQQYFTWLSKFLTADLGNSARYRGMPVTAMIRGRLPITFCLALFSLFFIIIITVPLSLLPMKQKHTFIDSLVNTITAISISMPGFFFGILLIWIFGLILRLFIPGSYVDYNTDFYGFLAYLIFPALAIALPNAAILVKFLRASIYKEWSSGYVRTARSKGADRRRTLYRHIIKNACLPALAIAGMIIGEVFSGSIVMEQVFSIPGIGRLLITSITSRDYQMVETLVVYIAFVVILANTMVDIAIQIIDPRIRLGPEQKS